MRNSKNYGIFLDDSKDVEIISDHEKINKNITKLAEYSKLNIEKNDSETLGSYNLNNMFF